VQLWHNHVARRIFLTTSRVIVAVWVIANLATPDRGGENPDSDLDWPGNSDMAIRVGKRAKQSNTLQGSDRTW